MAKSYSIASIPKNLLVSKQIFPRKKEIYKPADNFEDIFIDFTRKCFSIDNDINILDIELNDPLEKFTYLSQCQIKFNKAITNSHLAELNTVQDVMKYIGTEVNSSDNLYNLAEMKDSLPRNLHIQKDPHIFDPKTDTMFNGITAFPHLDRVETDLEAQKKYPSIKSIRSRKVKIELNDLY